MSDLKVKCPGCSCDITVSVRCDVSAPPGGKFDRTAYQREYMRKRRGRPSLGSPWKELGISRTAYFEKKKSGEIQ